MGDEFRWVRVSRIWRLTYNPQGRLAAMLKVSKTHFSNWYLEHFLHSRLRVNHIKANPVWKITGYLYLYSVPSMVICTLLTYGLSGSTLAQVMAWCLMAPSHYLNQCWRKSSNRNLYIVYQEVTSKVTCFGWHRNEIWFEIQWSGCGCFNKLRQR